MSSDRVHYEVFGRRKPTSDWTLEMATENRSAAVAMAEDLMENHRFAAARVSKETLDEDTREFRSVSILKLGKPEPERPKKPVQETADPPCVSPQDFYTLHARARIGELLENWLHIQLATPFDLLHRPDLAERLEASGEVLRHAIQKVAVPEAVARRVSSHKMIRAFHSLVDRSVARLVRDHETGVLVNLAVEPFAAAAERVVRLPDGPYLLGAGVAGALASARTWNEKVMRLLDLADEAPADGPARKLAFHVLEQPLAEMLGLSPETHDLLGEELDLGGQLGALTRLTAPESIELLAQHEPLVARVIPPISPAAERLAGWMADGAFGELRTALGKGILRELTGPRRLRPDDAASEITLLRGLAMALTAAAGKLLPLDDVQSAFSTRSRMLVTSDFVHAYLEKCMTAHDEARALVWLAENVIGGANKRQATRWLVGVIGSVKFESEMRDREETAAARLGKLAELQRQVGRCGLADEDAENLQTMLGNLGGKVEAEARLIHAVVRAEAPPLQRLGILLRLASGASAPLGPAAERARLEAMRLLKSAGGRAALAAEPDQIPVVMSLMQQAGIAA